MGFGLAAFLALLLAACTGPPPTATPAPTPTPTSTPTLVPTATPTATPEPIDYRSEEWVPPADLLEEVQFAVPPEGPSAEWDRARHLFVQALLLQYDFALEEAIQRYQLSIATYPTAEAYTFMAWTYSWMGEYEQAITWAEHAIEADPDYGNPYNDIGLYLIRLGRPDEAVAWLEQAIQAPRYAEPHFPRLNLGRVRVLHGDWDEALVQFVAAWELRPEEMQSFFPTRQAAGVVPPPEELRPADAETAVAVSEALASFASAWNRYDASALMEWSAPFTTAETEALLLQLAQAQYRGTQMTITDPETVHAEGAFAIVATVTQEDGPPFFRGCLLSRAEDRWRIVTALR